MQQEKDRLNLAPKKFVMWLFIFTSFMLFAAWTSAFIVYVGGKNHALNVILPGVFRYSTVVIFLSSITLVLAKRQAKGLQFAKQRLYLWITFALGCVFCGLQVYGWYILAYKMQVFFLNSNAAISFVYVITGAHLVHIVAGLLVLLNVLRASYRNIPQVMNLYKMEMASIFWHFLDIIWIYLYVFLLLNQY